MAAEPVSPEVAPTIVTRGVSFCQHVVEQAPEHLHRHVLEGQGRAVEQFLREQMGFQLHQRHDRGMVEAGVSVVTNFRQRFERDRFANEGCHHAGGEVRI